MTSADAPPICPTVRNGRTVALFVAATWALFLLAHVVHGTVHEVVGHGLVTLAVGGTFDGFDVRLGDRSHCYTSLPASASRWSRVASLGGGLFVSFCVGGAVLACTRGPRARTNPELRLVLLVFAMEFLVLEGAYYLATGISRDGDGDPARIVALYGGSPALAVGFFLVGTTVCVVAVPVCSVGLLGVGATFADLASFRRRLALHTLLVIVPAAILVFAMHVSLAASRQPAETFVFAGLLVPLALVARRPVPRLELRSISSRFGVAALVLAVLVLIVQQVWLAKGVHFGS